MTNARRKRREELFDIYAANLSKTEYGITDTFRCPICLKDFDRTALNLNQAITIGHVFPEATGERLYTLECGKCNHNIGTVYDSHRVNEKRYREWKSGEEGIRRFVHINYENIKVPATLSWKGKWLQMRPVGEKEPKYTKYYSNITSKQQQQAKLSFSFDIETKYNPTNRDKSLIHSALLMMFYCFGYEYISNPSVGIVRSVISGIKTVYQPSQMIAYTDIPSIALPAVAVIRKPSDISSFVVIAPADKFMSKVRAIFLPGLDDLGEEKFKHLLELQIPSGTKENIKNVLASTATITNATEFNLDDETQYGFCKKFWQEKDTDFKPATDTI